MFEQISNWNLGISLIVTLSPSARAEAQNMFKIVYWINNRSKWSLILFE